MHQILNYPGNQITWHVSTQILQDTLRDQFKDSTVGINADWTEKLCKAHGILLYKHS